MSEADLRKTGADIVQLLREGGAPSEAIAVAEARLSESEPVAFPSTSRDHILEVYSWRFESPTFDYSMMPGSEVLLQRLSKHPSPVIRGAVISSSTNTAIIWLNDEGTILVAALAVRPESPSD